MTNDLHTLRSLSPIIASYYCPLLFHDQDHPVDNKTLLTTGAVGAVSGGGMKAIEVRKIVVESYGNVKEPIGKLLRK